MIEKMKSYKIFYTLFKKLREIESIRRRRIENQIPKILLLEDNMRNCELLLNRKALLSKLKRHGVVAEIGVAYGDFSRLIHQITEPNILHLIDNWKSPEYRNGFDFVNKIFEGHIKTGCIKIHKKLSTEAADEFPDCYFDWIYIDTDHSYKLTNNELNLFSAKIKNNGIIAGHDYKMGNYVYSIRYGVIEAVHEFCVKNDWELIFLTLDPTENPSYAIRRIQEQ